MSFTTDVQHDPADAWFAEQAANAFLAARSSGPRAAIVERSARAGSMGPLHRRREDEIYRVVEGEVTFFVGPEAIRAAEGDVVVAPAGVARTFHVEHGPASWTVLTRVNSYERFVDFGRAVSPAPASDRLAWPCASEEAALAAIGAPNGIELLGPPGALPLS